VPVTGPSSVALLLALSSGAPQEPPRFATQVEGVYVDAFVTHDGEPVPGLTAENFEIRDNGVRQEVRLVSLDSVPVAVLLVFDTSASVAGEALGDLRAAGHAVLDSLHPGEKAALITFNQEVAVRMAPDADLARVHDALDHVRAHGATALYDAVYMALALPTDGARSLIVLFSDGEDNSSWLQAAEVRATAERADVVLQAVGATDTRATVVRGRTGPVSSNPSLRRSASPRVEELRRMAELTGGRFWKAEKTEELKDTFLRILDEMRTRYLLTYQPTGVEPTGEHELDVRLKGAKGKVRARRHYTVAPSSQ
jgi:Ca-activated chloride channel family protein